MRRVFHLHIGDLSASHLVLNEVAIRDAASRRLLMVRGHGGCSMSMKHFAASISWSALRWPLLALAVLAFATTASCAQPAAGCGEGGAGATHHPPPTPPSLRHKGGAPPPP